MDKTNLPKEKDIIENKHNVQIRRVSTVLLKKDKTTERVNIFSANDRRPPLKRGTVVNALNIAIQIIHKILVKSWFLKSTKTIVVPKNQNFNFKYTCPITFNINVFLEPSRTVPDIISELDIKAS